MNKILNGYGLVPDYVPEEMESSYIKAMFAHHKTSPIHTRRGCLMSTDKMREEFEKSFTEMMMNERNSNDENVRHHLRRIGTYDMYGDRFTGAAWWAWKASRAAIEVDLPPEWSPVSERDDGANEMREHCVSAIESLGLKVKP